MSKGFIKLNRGFFDSHLWNEARVYSKAEAWLDLIQSARFEANTEVINSNVIELQRGEIPASRRFLESRWSWGGTKVANFLKLLKGQGMITQRVSKGQTVLNLVKYELYNGSHNLGNHQTSRNSLSVGKGFNNKANHQTNHRQTTDKPPTNQSKRSKRTKELKNSSSKPRTTSLKIIKDKKKQFQENANPKSLEEIKKEIFSDKEIMNRLQSDLNINSDSLKDELNEFSEYLKENKIKQKNKQSFLTHFKNNKIKFGVDVFKSKKSSSSPMKKHLKHKSEAEKRLKKLMSIKN